MKLAEYMEANRLDDAKMAALLGCSRVTVSRYRRGLELPSSERVKKIVEVCAGLVSANELLGIAQSEAAE